MTSEEASRFSNAIANDVTFQVDCAANRVDTDRDRMTVSASNNGRALDGERLQVQGRHIQIRRGVQDVYVGAMIH